MWDEEGKDGGVEGGGGDDRVAPQGCTRNLVSFLFEGMPLIYSILFMDDEKPTFIFFFFLFSHVKLGTCEF